MKTATAAKPITLPTANRLDHACKKFWRSRYLLLMLLPALIWYIVFMYSPMYGAQIAFRDFSPVLGITAASGSASNISPSSLNPSILAV